MDECMFALLEDPEPQEILTPGVCVEVQYNTHTHTHTHTLAHLCSTNIGLHVHMYKLDKVLE